MLKLNVNAPPAPKIKEEIFKLMRTEVGITESDITVVTGQGLQNIWDYLVPVGHSLIFHSTDHFSAYLETTAPAECGATSTVDIVITDSSRQSVRSLLNTVQYRQLKEFADSDYFCHLDVPPGEVVIAREGERVIVRGNVNGNLDASDSYFELLCTRVRRSLFS
jgi:hypothetical protein